MEPQQPRPQRPHPHPHPHLHNLLPVAPSPSSSPSSPQVAANSRVIGITPVSSPGLFSPGPASASPHAGNVTTTSPLPGGTNLAPPGPTHANSYPLPHQPVRETHTANVDRDDATGRKTINEYQVLEEIGRGQHGKVKLARNSFTGQLVAIKIIPRLSKTRRLGKVSAADPRQNTKREIAILKKIRHENVVALLEVIDDPELQKIYMVLEHVERGEVTWRKKGVPNICYFERYRFEKGVHGEELAPGECNWHAVLDRKATIRALKEARASGLPPPVNEWTTKYGVTADDEDDQPPWWYIAGTGPSSDAPHLESPAYSRVTSREPSRVPSSTSVASVHMPHSYGSEPSFLSMMAEDGHSGDETPGAGLLRSRDMSATALDGSMFGAYVDDSSSVCLRQRSPSVADSIVSHMSRIDYNAMVHDPYADDFSYVPCFSIDQTRTAFRDTVLGLEYLHYHGVVHRDIKPANLLWTRSFRVKISDFGVSYFGRPIREGEPGSALMEDEALDFDDDRELSKTVGTPAFFAPELCYTDVDKEPPRVSEQIDVWSLGVTLYCLLFARIPFLAEDEFSMFRKIATEDAFIPHRRLKPVGIFTDPTGSSLYQRTNVHPYRSDADPEYEEISDSLLDLLDKMLTKDPEKRIRLRDVKRHKWVTEDIDNVVAWLDSTDPSRTQDRRIQVDEAEIGEAVVPLNFLQRARSAVKRAVDMVVHPRSGRDESVGTPSRRRAASSATSSVAEHAAAHFAAALHHNNTTNSNEYNHISGRDNGNSHGHKHSYSHNHPYHNNHNRQPPRDGPRKSLRGDDYFATVTQLPSEHPLSQHVTVSPYDSPGESNPDPVPAQPLMSAGDLSARPRLRPGMPGIFDGVSNVDGSGDTNSAVVPRPITRHAHSRSITNAMLNRPPTPLREAHTVPTTPADADTSSATQTVRRTREVRSATDANYRTRSVDRAGIVFTSTDKRASPVVGVNATYVPGTVNTPKLSGPTSFAGFDQTNSHNDESAAVTSSSVTDHPLLHGLSISSRPSSSLPSPQFFSSDAISAYQVGCQSTFDANNHHHHQTPSAAAHLEERPGTAQHVQNFATDDTDSLNLRASATSGGVSTDLPAETSHKLGTETQQLGVEPASIPCPPSPKDFAFALDDRQAGTPSCSGGGMSSTVKSHPASNRPIATPTATSSSSASFGAFDQTPLTSPSEATTSSFIRTQSETGKDGVNPMLTFRSDPSLPALLSGASSVSADMEGDFLGNPGSPDKASLVSAADSLTPPALEKVTDPVPIDHSQETSFDGRRKWGSGGAIPVELDKARTPVATPVRGNTHYYTDDEVEESDSDEGIMMAKAKKKGTGFSREPTPVAHGSRAQAARRRDTNTSIGSTDTAKKVAVQNEY
ncbi:serine/threonine-protein kinase [Niveomyces insectorum RCEF 264]|uniref:non-specific serine/threonine protein kinase n=1 Tax=Niveomyces insectorum RCEF 264 TaxID=1081102 RepID=A0A167TT83_9HYPO|nr:serine/threonine-protein kinase [Niveomyces insectorum RCEF 264]